RPPPEIRGGSRRDPEDRAEGSGMARPAGTARGGRRLQSQSARRGRRSAAPKRKGLKSIGIVDTSFARYDMASAAIDELRKQGGGFVIDRYTVPGIKDLAAGARILFDRGSDLVLALGMVGRQPVDKDCALAADFGLQFVQAELGKHILGVMVHEEEASTEADLAVGMRSGKPIGIGITGPGMTDEQALARVGKGAEAVDVAVAMHDLLRKL